MKRYQSAKMNLRMRKTAVRSRRRTEMRRVLRKGGIRSVD
ncbi:hypothetical protein HMPREF3193_01801 [Bifidobacterium breve]|nr:hypothetical protein HMPREF3193_01801 [Bifidobacterium breve]